MKISNHIFSILSSALLLTLWLPATTALASSDFWCKVDSSMSIRYHRPQIDTAYLSRPATKWTFKVKTNTTGAGIKATGESNGTKMETNLNAAAKQTYAVGVAYLGLGASLSINPANLQGKYNDWEFNLSLYQRQGIETDFMFQSAKTFSGTVKREGKEQRVDAGLVTQQMGDINAYYVFNHKRFSYPAATSQSYLQKKSCGSLIAGIAYFGAIIKTDADSALTESNVDIRISHWGIGAGYGYNLVAWHNWLFHLSTMPSIIAYSHNRLTISGKRQTFANRFPDVIIMGKGAIVYNRDRYFMSSNMIFNFSDTEAGKNLKIENTKWKICVVMGIRL
jgi:hypothetical protein